MSLTEKITMMLIQGAGEPISGEVMATELGVSRAAIWKGVKALKEQGYAITATPNKGYALTAESDILSAAAIGKYLREPYRDIAITIEEKTTSTNTLAKTMAINGAPANSMVTAREQTQGRGRQGHGFFSPADKSVYLSIILRPHKKLKETTLFTIAAAVAVCRVISHLTEHKPKIKWVNDIFLGEKKVAGILTEAIGDMESGMTEAVVIGIGLNLTIAPREFPETLQAKAVSLFPLKKNRNLWIGHLVNELLDVTTTIKPQDLLAEYKSHSLVLGRHVAYEYGGAQRQGLVVDINNRGNLVVQTEEGLDTLESGEISLRSI